MSITLKFVHLKNNFGLIPVTITICIFQAFICHQSCGLSCYECVFSKEEPYDGAKFTEKCLEPDKDKAPTRLCIAPEDKSCSKAHEIFTADDGTVVAHHLVRGCSDTRLDPKKEKCTGFTPGQQFAFNQTEDKKKVAHQNSKGNGGGFSMLPFKSRTRRSTKEIITVTLSGNTCFCDKKDFCNNQPGQETSDTESAAVPIHLDLSHLYLILIPTGYRHSP